MKEQTIRCETCKAVVAYVFDRDGRRKVRFTFGAPVATVVNGEPQAKSISSQWFVVDVEEELDDATDSIIEVECDCAESGRPRKWSFPLRATLEQLGTRRGIAL